MSITPQPTVRAWQHATDPDRVLIVWPDGKSMVVNAGRYIEDEPTMEPPDHWRPIGKHPSGTLQSTRQAPAKTEPIPDHMRGHKYRGHHLHDHARTVEGMLLGNAHEQTDWAHGVAWLLGDDGNTNPVSAGSLVVIERRPSIWKDEPDSPYRSAQPTEAETA